MTSTVPMPMRVLLAAAVVLAASAPRSIAQVPQPAPDPAGAVTTSTNGIQLSFQGANIDMVVQWLAQTTGKSVLKHPQAQCQVTIVGATALSQRDAIALVYRALSMEGFSAIESSNSILIVPEGREPRMDPELVDSAQGTVPAGRQRLVKIFSLRHATANEVRDKLKPVLSDKSQIEVNERGNQLIITDYNDGLNLAGNLIRALDTDRIGDRTVRVLQLKHVSAQDLSKELTPLYQKLGGKGTDTVEVTANERSNTLIVLSSESNFEAVQRIVESLDTDDAQEKALHAFPLKNADAEDVARQIKELLSAQDSSNRYPYYIFGDSSASNRNSKKVSVVADRRRNTVVVQAPPAELSGLRKMIESLDEPVEGESLTPRIFALKYVSAVDVEDVLNELFLKKSQQQRPYWYYDEQPPEVADRNVGRLYGKVRITSEPYSNSIIVTANSAEGLAAVEEVLKRLDAPSQAGESTLRLSLKFAKAATVANSLNVLFAKNGSPPIRPGNPVQQQNQPQPNFNQGQGGPTTDRSFELERENEEEGYFPWLGGAPDNARGSDSRGGIRQVSDLVGRVRVVADHRSNALMLSASVHLLPQILRLVDDLDAPTPQVMIEARIVEVASNFLDRLGVRWSPDGSRVFTPEDYDNSLMIGTRGQYTKGFGGMTTANTPMGGSVAQALASLQSGVIDNRIGMDFLIQFLRQNVGATVLAEPKITVGDNETAKLFVGSQIPFIKDSQSTQVGSLNQTFSYKDVGVILEVVPHLNLDGDVNLKIRAESSTIQPGQTLFGGAILDTRNFKTHLTARSGQTHVLGGIIQKQESETVRKVPGLGSIPGLGWAFKKKDKSIREVELLVFLKPTVIRTPEDARAMTEDVGNRMPLIEGWRRDNQTGTNTTGAAEMPGSRK